MLKCYKCGHSNDADANFCNKCAASLNKVENNSVRIDSNDNQATTNKKGGRKKVGADISFYALVLFGLVTIIFWVFTDYTYKVLFTNYFGQIKNLLWITIHLRMLMGAVLILIAFWCVFISNSKRLIITATFLILAALMNITNDLLAIPAMADYDHYIDVEMVWHDVNIWWVILGVFQIVTGTFFFLKYRQISASFA